MSKNLYEDIEVVDGLYIGSSSVSKKSKTSIDILVNDSYEIEKYVDLISFFFSSGKSVYVRSSHGKSKAPVVVAGYMCKYLDYNIEDALEFIQSKREVDINLLDYLNLVDFIEK